MAQISLIPVTLRSVQLTLGRLGYAIVIDDGHDFVWKKIGPAPSGLEQAYRNWPLVVTKQYPSFKAEGHDISVYDRSDVTDLIVNITGTDRTNGVRIAALLRSDSDDPELPPAHVIKSTCSKCGKPAKIERWETSMQGATFKCTGCGHEEFKSNSN